jgi:anti-anti-sigma factor
VGPYAAIVGQSPSTPGGTIEIDLARLTFIDSSGIRVLCTAAQGLGPQGHLVVFPPTRAVRRTIQLTGLDGLIGIVDDRPHNPQSPR